MLIFYIFISVGLYGNRYSMFSVVSESINPVTHRDMYLEK